MRFLKKGKTGSSSFSDYDDCLKIAKELIQSNEIAYRPKNGLLLDLNGSLNQGNCYNEEANSWNNRANSNLISISSGSWDTDKSLIFNGSSTEFNTGIAQSELANGYTIIARVKPVEWQNHRGFFGLHGNRNGIIGFQFYNTVIQYGHSPYTVNIETEKLSINNYHIIVVKYNTSSSKVSIYIDNALVAEQNVVLTAIGNLIVGKAYDGSNRYFKGNLSHILVYNRIVDDSELDIIMNYIEMTREV